ncbi:hypothetical protein D3C87_1987480 [compost metagenome]
MGPLAFGARIDMNDAIAVTADTADARRRSRGGKDRTFRNAGNADIRSLAEPVHRAGAMGARPVSGGHQRPAAGFRSDMRQNALETR